MQSISQNVIINKPTPSFYRLDALPVAQPTVSALKEKQASNSNNNNIIITVFNILLSFHACSFVLVGKKIITIIIIEFLWHYTAITSEVSNDHYSVQP